MPKNLSKSKLLPKNYKSVLAGLKKRIKSAQLKASISVNQEMILLYWDFGKEVVTRQEKDGWGKSIVEQLAKDLRTSFPQMTGFSNRNIWRMRSFYLAYTRAINQNKDVVPEEFTSKLPQLVAEIPWGHNSVLIEKVKDIEKRLWYATKTIEHGWSREVLIHQIETGLYSRQARGKELTNFSQTLLPEQSDLAHELVKDPYDLGFLPVYGDIKEKELQRNLIMRLRDFLVELGVGFSFVGSEYHLEVGGQDFYIDLLFYHLKLRCFVILELKTVPFQPEFAGKMNFYLSAVDDLITHKDDKPSIGIILCKDKNKTIVEYALRDSKKPMGVSSYKLTETLPKELKKQLPSVEQLENEIKNQDAKN